MELPCGSDAVVDARKLHSYLLSSSHPVGRFDARFFRRLGFSAEEWELLEAEIQRSAREHEVEPVDSSEFGTKYLMRSRITGPGGDAAEAILVWMIRRGEDVPKLVTAYPGEEL
jgi:hypothetical protein